MGETAGDQFQYYVPRSPSRSLNVRQIWRTISAQQIGGCWGMGSAHLCPGIPFTAWLGCNLLEAVHDTRSVNNTEAKKNRCPVAEPIIAV